MEDTSKGILIMQLKAPMTLEQAKELSIKLAELFPGAETDCEFIEDCNPKKLN